VAWRRSEMRGRGSTGPKGLLSRAPVAADRTRSAGHYFLGRPSWAPRGPAWGAAGRAADGRGADGRAKLRGAAGRVTGGRTAGARGAETGGRTAGRGIDTGGRAAGARGAVAGGRGAVVRAAGALGLGVTRGVTGGLVRGTAPCGRGAVRGTAGEVRGTDGDDWGADGTVREAEGLVRGSAGAAGGAEGLTRGLAGAVRGSAGVVFGAGACRAGAPDGSREPPAAGRRSVGPAGEPVGLGVAFGAGALAAARGRPMAAGRGADRAGRLPAPPAPGLLRGPPGAEPTVPGVVRPTGFRATGSAARSGVACGPVPRRAASWPSVVARRAATSRVACPAWANCRRAGSPTDSNRRRPDRATLLIEFTIVTLFTFTLLTV